MSIGRRSFVKKSVAGAILAVTPLAMTSLINAQGSGGGGYYTKYDTTIPDYETTEPGTTNPETETFPETTGSPETTDVY